MPWGRVLLPSNEVIYCWFQKTPERQSCLKSSQGWWFLQDVGFPLKPKPTLSVALTHPYQVENPSLLSRSCTLIVEYGYVPLPKLIIVSQYLFFSVNPSVETAWLLSFSDTINSKSFSYQKSNWMESYLGLFFCFSFYFPPQNVHFSDVLQWCHQMFFKHNSVKICHLVRTWSCCLWKFMNRKYLECLLTSKWMVTAFTRSTYMYLFHFKWIITALRAK